MKKVNWRKYHRIVSFWIAIPFFIVLTTGIILQLRQKISFVQPKQVKMHLLENQDFLSWPEIINRSKVHPLEIQQIIFKPQKNHLSLRMVNGEEIQMHPQTGEILFRQKRWTTFLINLHQGSFLGNGGQYFIFFPSALGVFFLLLSGLFLFPKRSKLIKKRSSTHE